MTWLVMGRRLFLLCILSGFCATAFASELSDANAEADRIHSNGKTALMVAAKNDDKDRVEKLIALGADVNHANHNGGTPIMYAALSGDPGMISLLLRHGAAVNAAAKNGWTALMIASVKGYVDVARVLLDHGADAGRADMFSWTPLMRAVYEDRPHIVQLLLARDTAGVNTPGEKGMTALHLAVLKRDPEVVKLLLAAGADPGIKDDSGRTAADFARQNKDLAMEKLILTARGN
ncbi:MAG: ankyrin repeat domain-containing protein [Arenicellales bacterium]